LKILYQVSLIIHSVNALASGTGTRSAVLTVDFAALTGQKATASSVKIIVFTTGISMRGEQERTYTVAASFVNSQFYTVTLTVQGSSSISSYSFCTIAYNQVALQSSSVNYVDAGQVTGVDGGWSSLSFNFTASFDSGIIVGLTAFSYPSGVSPNFILSPGLPYGLSGSGAFNSLSFSYFNVRARNCTDGSPYFEPLSVRCYETCPEATYLEGDSRICRACHYSCNRCSGPSATNCTACSTASNRVLRATSCSCAANYYESGYDDNNNGNDSDRINDHESDHEDDHEDDHSEDREAGS
jgi:hypothetical protein